MTETLAVLLPFLFADVVNPVLFAFLVYATGTNKPVLNSSAMLLGHTLAYFSAGIIVALGLERIVSYLANPQSIDYVIGFVVGLLLLWVALSSGKKREQRPRDDSGKLTPITAFGLGAVVNFVGVPFALPYFAAIDQILKADLSTTEALVLLTVYNVLYALPFVIVPAMVALIGEKSGPVLHRINAALDRASAFLMPIILGLIGLVLMADAILYFATGEGLI